MCTVQNIEFCLFTVSIGFVLHGACFASFLTKKWERFRVCIWIGMSRLLPATHSKSTHKLDYYIERILEFDLNKFLPTKTTSVGSLALFTHFSPIAWCRRRRWSNLMAFEYKKKYERQQTSSGDFQPALRTFDLIQSQNNDRKVGVFLNAHDFFYFNK